MLRRVVLAAAGLVLLAVETGAEELAHRVGVLSTIENPEEMGAWIEGLRERGYVVGRNLRVEYRYSQGRTERIRGLVAELVAFDPEVIVARGPQNTLAVHAAAPTIPLVFINVADPIALGLVKSLAHPGGNVTGFATMVPDGFVGKQLQLLKALVPHASRIAVLLNSTNPIHQGEKVKFPEYGRLLKVEWIFVEVSKPDQFETAFETAREQGADAIHIAGDPLVSSHAAKVVELAARYRLPADYGERNHVLDGGLMSYARNPVDLWRRAGAHVGRILKGERPADLPVEQPTRYQLVVNLKTAAALGITVPPAILVQADEVIE
ncbi:MAG TPA: ABC transporter substrate-binding protein [Stellaceae bacterium]|nr:ABC transporter substrate-binding protein [Stellaceae bacterium]